MTQENQEHIPHEPQASADDLFMPAGKFPVLTDYLVFFGIFFVAQFIGFMAAFIVGLRMPHLSLLESTDEAVSSAAQVAMSHFNAVVYIVAMALTIVGFLLYRRYRRGPKIIARFSLRGLNPVLLIWGVLFMAATSVVIEPLLNILPDVPDAYGRGAWAFITLVIAAPLFEEVIFRGVLLESTRAKYGVMAAWITSSVIFGIVHVHLTVAVNACLLGLIFGFIYIKSESLWTTIILHAVNNGIAFAMMSAGEQNQTISEMLDSPTLYVLIYISAAAIFAVSGYMMFRTLKNLKESEKNNAAA